MIKISLENIMNKEDWLKQRSSGIGGSDASIIANVNKYKSVIELWLEKTGQAELKETDNEATYWGTTLEDVIRLEFNKRSGLYAEKPNYMYRSEEYPFMLANLDGEVIDEVYGPCIFEAKTVSAYKKNEWEGQIPIEYYLQLQHYMCVTGYKGAYIAALIGGNEFIYRFIERDEETIKLLIEIESIFWQKVTDLVAPEVDGSDAAKSYLNNIYPQASNNEVLQLDEEGASLINEYDLICKKADGIADKKTEIENKLKALMKEHEIGVVNDRKVVWKNITTKRLDSKMLKINAPEVYEEYAKETISRRFTVS